MSWDKTDLTPLLVPPPGSELEFGQGVIRSYDQLTAANTVEYRGALLADLPLLNSSEAKLLVPGKVVGVLSWRHQHFILGRITRPHSEDAATALDMVRTFVASTPEVLSISSSDWDAPAVGSPGPVVPDVLVSHSGRCQVLISAADIEPGLSDGDVGTVQMSFEIAGATTRSPGFSVLSLGRVASGTGGVDVPQGGFGTHVLVEDLNPGLHTFTCVYQITGDVSTSFIVSPTMTVQPF